MVEKFHSRNSKNCFNCSFQCNKNRFRIHFLTILFFSRSLSQKYLKTIGIGILNKDKVFSK
nr:hypothetical protein [Leptospira sp. ZV016]